MIDQILAIEVPREWKAEILGETGNDDTMPNILREANLKLKQAGTATKGIGKGKKGTPA